MNMKKTILLTFIILIITLLVLADNPEALNFPNLVYGEEGEIFPGVTWQTASSQEPRWELIIIRVDLSNRNILLRPAHQERQRTFFRTSTIAARENAIAAVNGSFFGIWNPDNHPDHPMAPYFGQSTEYCRINGTTLAPNRRNSSRATFGLSHDRERHFSYIGPDQVFDNPDWNGVLHALAGNPKLVREGEVVSGLNNETRHPRTILGWNNSNKIITLVTIDGRQPEWSIGMTRHELALLLLDLGCENGINYDGGGSTTAWIQGEVVNRYSDASERGTVTAWLVIPAYVIDHTDEECTVQGNWFISDSHDYYNTNALLTMGGDPERMVTWRPDLAKAGSYKIYTWYVDGAARTANAAYTIQSASGENTVIIDQRYGGGEWISLGTYSFSAGTQGSVTLNNTASEGELLSADSVKFVYIGPDQNQLFLE